MKLDPSRLLDASELRKVAANSGWLGLEQVIRLCTTFLTTSWFARQLGPADFGLFSYTLTITMLAVGLTSLGLNPIIVRDLVRLRDRENTVLGSSFVIYSAASFLCYGIAVGSIFAFVHRDVEAIRLEAILAISVFLQPFMVIDLYFQSRYQSRFTVVSKIFSTISINLIRVFIIIRGANIYAFAATIPLEYFITIATLLYVYSRTGERIRDWKVDALLLRQYSQRCAPLVLAILATQVQARADMIMLGVFCGKETLGLYSAALRLVEITAVVPPILGISLSPLLARCKISGTHYFIRSLTSSYRLVAIYSFVVIALFAYFGRLAIMTFYGVRYEAAASLVIILSLRLLLSGFGSVKQLFIINYGAYWWGTLMAFVGVLTNLFLNMVLIPRYGAAGAIYASLVSFSLTTILLDAVVPKMRVNFYSMLKAVVTPWAIRMEDFQAPAPDVTRKPPETQ